MSCCNDIGGWGRGFVVAVSCRWPECGYRRWYAERATRGFALGEVRLVQVAPTTWVTNMIAQHGINQSPDGPPIRYEAVERCLNTLVGNASQAAISCDLGMRALRPDGSPVPGLFVAGNSATRANVGYAVGGHGYGLGWALVSGRIAGTEAARCAVAAPAAG